MFDEGDSGPCDGGWVLVFVFGKGRVLGMRERKVDDFEADRVIHVVKAIVCSWNIAMIESSKS